MLVHSGDRPSQRLPACCKEEEGKEGGQGLTERSQGPLSPAGSQAGGGAVAGTRNPRTHLLGTGSGTWLGSGSCSRRAGGGDG